MVRLIVLRTAGQGKLSRAGYLYDAEGLEKAEEGRHLVLVARQLDDERVLREVGDLGAEDLLDLEDLGPALRVGPHLDEHELPCDRALVLEVHDLDHVNQLTELLRAEV